MTSEMSGLEQLIGVLQRAIDGRPKDAIDAELSRPARQTGVGAIAEAPEVEAFRREILDGMIRVDTANQLLRLVSIVVEKVLP